MQLPGLTADYAYGQERLAALIGGLQSWYVGDLQGSVRYTQNSLGAAGTGITHYDPFGVPDAGTAPSVYGATGCP